LFSADGFEDAAEMTLASHFWYAAELGLMISSKRWTVASKAREQNLL
jgi:hypothetical protein